MPNLPILKETFHGVLVLAAYGDVPEDKVRLKKCVRNSLNRGARRIVIDVSRLGIPANPIDPFDSCNLWQTDLVSATRLARICGAKVAWVIRGFETLSLDDRKHLSRVLFGIKDVDIYGTREDAVNALK